MQSWIINMYYNTSIYLDPDTQDYVNLNGQIENKNQVVTEIYLRLTIPQKKYMYAKDPTIGSLLYSLVVLLIKLIPLLHDTYCR